MKKFIFLGCFLSSVFFLTSAKATISIAEQVESKRVDRGDKVIIDNWSGLVWDDLFRSKKMNFTEAKAMCNNLSLGRYSNFRLPTAAELKTVVDIRSYFYYIGTPNYWTNYRWKVISLRSGRARVPKPNWKMLTRCVQGEIHKNFKDLKNKIAEVKQQKVSDRDKAIFNKVKNKNTLKDYSNFINTYTDSNYLDDAKIKKKNILNEMFDKAAKENSISAYEIYIKTVSKYSKFKINASLENIYRLLVAKNDFGMYQAFISEYSWSPLAERAKGQVYNLIKNEDSIAGYWWFLKTYPDAKESREALKNLHKSAFAMADDIGTIASYNDFIIAYPFATQVDLANQKAYALEEDEYSSFFTSDAKLSRALLVRSKQMERKARDGSRAQRPGYMLVVNRMNELLQEQFPAEEATLRYLESEEFKSFYRDFKRVLNRIDRKLADIRSNTSNLSRLVKEQTRLMDSHFSKAAESREMSAELTKQHRFWERYLAKN